MKIGCLVKLRKTICAEWYEQLPRKIKAGYLTVIGFDSEPNRQGFMFVTNRKKKVINFSISENCLKECTVREIAKAKLKNKL